MSAPLSGLLPVPTVIREPVLPVSPRHLQLPPVNAGDLYAKLFVGMSYVSKALTPPVTRAVSRHVTLSDGSLHLICS